MHANVTPSKLWRKASSDVFPEKVLTHPAWPLYANIHNHPPQCLVSQRAIWLLQYCPTWVRRGLILGSQMQWSPVINPTICRPTTWFQSHPTCCALNRFCTGKGSGASNWHNARSKWVSRHTRWSTLHSCTHSSRQQRCSKLAATNCYERNHETKKKRSTYCCHSPSKFRNTIPYTSRKVKPPTIIYQWWSGFITDFLQRDFLQNMVIPHWDFPH